MGLNEKLAVYFGFLLVIVVVFLVFDLRLDLEEFVSTGQLKYYDDYNQNSDLSGWKTKLPIRSKPEKHKGTLNNYGSTPSNHKSTSTTHLSTPVILFSTKHMTTNTKIPHNNAESILRYYKSKKKVTFDAYKKLRMIELFRGFKQSGRVDSKEKKKHTAKMKINNQTQLYPKLEFFNIPKIVKTSIILAEINPNEHLNKIDQKHDSHKAVPIEKKVEPTETTLGILNTANDEKLKSKTSSSLQSTETSTSSHDDHNSTSSSNTSINNTVYPVVSISNRYDKFEDLQAIIDTPIDSDNNPQYTDIIIPTQINLYNPTMGELLGVSESDMVNATNLEKFHMKISKHELYRESEPLVDAVLFDMKYLPVIAVEEKSGGTQFKLTITFPNDIKALYKPIRCPREEETYPNRTYFTDLERHNAEIAAFHLDRALGFRRTMPVIGRTLNIKEVLYKLAPRGYFQKFVKDDKLCFYTECQLYCDKAHAICGNPDILEGSFASYLPQFEKGLRSTRIHPWRRSYQLNAKARWEMDDNYCDKVKVRAPFDNGRFLLDLMDLAVLDFLAGNQDRHHFETFKIFDGDNMNDTFSVYYDHGRGHGRAFVDDLLILAPMVQCCLVRSSTLEVLLKFQNGPKHLSQIMRESMANDPIAPILWEPHLAALDRRVVLILKVIRDCINKVTPASSVQESSAPA